MSESEVKEAVATLTSAELAEIGAKPKKVRKQRKVTQVVLSLPQLKQVLKKTNGQHIDQALYEACVASKIEPPKKLILTIKNLEAKALNGFKPQTENAAPAVSNAERVYTVGQRVRVISPGWAGEGSIQSVNGNGIYTIQMLSGGHGGQVGSFSVRHIRLPFVAEAASNTPYAVNNMVRIERGEYAGSTGYVTRLDTRSGRPWQVCVRIEMGRGQGQDLAFPVARVRQIPFNTYTVGERVRVIARDWAGESTLR